MLSYMTLVALNTAIARHIKLDIFFYKITKYLTTIKYLKLTHVGYFIHFTFNRGCRGHDCMVVEFTTICAISAYHHLSCEFEPRSWQGVLDTTLFDKVYLTCGRSVVFSGYFGFLHQ